MLVSLSMIPTAVAAWMVSLIPSSYLAEHPILTLSVFIGNFIVSIGLMFWAMRARNTGWGVFTMLLFAASMGAMMGPAINHTLKIPNGAMLIASAALVTCLTLVVITAYVWITKKDFSFMGGFLSAALMAVIGMSIIGIFFQSSTYQIAVSCVSVVLFIGFLLHDISQVVTGGEKNYVIAAISVYLDMLNLFVSLLNIFRGGK